MSVEYGYGYVFEQLHVDKHVCMCKCKEVGRNACASDRTSK